MSSTNRIAASGGQLGVAGAYSYELIVAKDAKEIVGTATVLEVKQLTAS